MAALLPFSVVVARLVNPTVAIPSVPSFIYCPWLGLLMAWSGWRVVRQHAGTMRAASFGGATTFLAASVTGILASNLVTPTHESRVSFWSPAVLAPVLIIMAVFSLGAMAVGWFGAWLALRKTSGIAT